MKVRGLFLSALLACGRDEVSAELADGGAPARDGGGSAPDASVSPVAPDASVSPDAAAPGIATAVITTRHRAIPGKMFGGWGPHLGHLVRRVTASGTELWFVDDACDPSGTITTPCDVDVNGRVDAFRLGVAGWERRASITLPSGVQQNTGTIATSDGFEVHGVDVATSRIVTCRLDPGTLASSCAPIPIALPPSTNYVGAAISPDGWKLTWATTVVDGGGGTFHWFVDYGGGWNGPRTGGLGGYNDASYVNVAFGGGGKKASFVAFAQLVSGLAPNWSFLGAVADGDASSANALTFALAAGPANDPVVSTNDVVIDPGTNDASLLARTQSGAAAVSFRPSGGAWQAPSFVLPSTYRARFVQLAGGRLALVYAKNGVGLGVRVAPASRPAGAPVAWANLPEIEVPLPAGYGSIYVIYTESLSTQRVAPPTLDVAVVGATRENEVLHVHVEP